jgi:hypothetical protein
MSLETCCIFVTKALGLKLFKNIISTYSESHTKSKDTIWEENQQVFACEVR